MVAKAKIETWGFKTAVHKLMGDVTDATSITYTVYGTNQLTNDLQIHWSLQNWMGSSLVHARPVHQVSWKWRCCFFRNPADKQTNQQVMNTLANSNKIMTLTFDASFCYLTVFSSWCYGHILVGTRKVLRFSCIHAGQASWSTMTIKGWSLQNSFTSCLKFSVV